jgi:phospholipase/carboxylesterase
VARPTTSRGSGVRPAVFSGHGDLDDVIPPRQARDAAEWLDRHTDHVQHRYPDLAHWVSDQEVRDITAFVRARNVAPADGSS